MAKKQELTEEQKGFKNLIKEIREAFKKLEVDEIVEILDLYGEAPIDDISDTILSWNTFFEKKEGKNKKPKITIPFIDINGNIFKVNFIISITTDVYYDFMRNKQLYRIIINKSEMDSVFYANTILNFDKKEERDIEIESLKQRLTEFDIKFY